MNKILIIIISGLIILFSYTLCHAEVFKWVDAQGNIHYSDKKPDNQLTEEIKIKAHTPDLSHLNDNNNQTDTVTANKPYKKKHKVTMYAASWCGYCKKARAYFQDHKIRYAEYDIEKNLKAKQRYEQLGGTGIPLLVAKRKQMQGFSEAKFKRWYDAL